MRRVVPGGLALWVLAASIFTAGIAAAQSASATVMADSAFTPIATANAADAPPAPPAPEPQPPGLPSAPAGDPAAPPASPDATADLEPTAGPPQVGQADYAWVWVLLLIALLLVLWLIMRGSGKPKTRIETRDRR